MHMCEHCRVGTMRPPKDNHPSYMECDSCSAMELKYIPMPYQEEMHQVDTEMGIDIIACFGGYG